MNEREVMRGIMRRRVAEKKAEIQQSAINVALSSLATGGRPRVDRSVARAVLMGAPHLWNGVNLSPVAKSLGAGVWELYIETKETK